MCVQGFFMGEMVCLMYLCVVCFCCQIVLSRCGSVVELVEFLLMVLQGCWYLKGGVIVQIDCELQDWVFDDMDGVFVVIMEDGVVFCFDMDE